MKPPPRRIFLCLPGLKAEDPETMVAVDACAKTAAAEGISAKTFAHQAFDTANQPAIQAIFPHSPKDVFNIYDIGSSETNPLIRAIARKVYDLSVPDTAASRPRKQLKKFGWYCCVLALIPFGLLVGRRTEYNSISNFALAILEINKQHDLTCNDQIVVYGATIGLLNELVELSVLLGIRMPALKLIFDELPETHQNWYRPFNKAAFQRRLQSSMLFSHCSIYIVAQALTEQYEEFLDCKITSLEVSNTAVKPVGNSSIDWSGFFKQICREELGEKPAPKLALYMCPPWFKTGGETVFRSQSEYLISRGYAILEVYPVFVPAALTWLLSGYYYYYVNLAQSNSNSCALIQYYLFPRTSLLSFLRLAINAFPHYFRSYASLHRCYYELMDIPKSLQKLSASGDIKLAFINHFYHFPLSKRINQTAPSVLATHDIQARPYFEREVKGIFKFRKDTYEELWQDELKFTQQADAIIAVNETEGEKYKQELPDNNIFSILSPINIKTLGLTEEKKDELDLDIITLMANHYANRDGLTWYVNEVSVHLPEDIKLTVIGSVCYSFSEQDQAAMKNVEFAGMVDSVSEYYQRAKVVLLPIHSGGGIGIKTMEAVLTDSAFCATPHAFRGLPEELVKKIPCFDDPATMAQDIVQLVKDESARNERRRISSKLADEFFSLEIYEQKMDECLKSVRSLDTQSAVSAVAPGLS